MNLPLAAAPVTSSDWQKLAPHPRLLANESKWKALSAQIRSDSISADLFHLVRSQADAILDQPTVVYAKEGRRLLGPARQCLGRILSLGMVFRLTGEARYAERALAEMRAAAAIPDWNPSHYLDTAELTLALALGYDWLFDLLTPADRELIRQAILKKGLRPSLDGPSGHALWWITAPNNWNQVCHAGMVAGGLAIAPDDEGLGVELVNRALENLPKAAHAYAPDGAYTEGPGYWSYGTTFHLMLTESLRSALGSSFGTEAFPGFLESADFMRQTLSPTGKSFNYADGHLGRGFQPALFWFARERRQTSIVDNDLAQLARLSQSLPREATRAYPPNYLLPLALLWWQPGGDQPERPMPLHWAGRGPNPVAIHRSAWNDPRAVFLAIKGGRPNSNHAHMDAGSFVLEAKGVRWAVDLGMQDYHSLESRGLQLWANDAHADRWKIFRLGPESHNILRFNGHPPASDGFAEIVASVDSPAGSRSWVDLTAAYARDAAFVRRGVELRPDQTLRIQDEWQTRDQLAEITFQWLTFAEVTVAGPRLTLREAGESLAIQIREPRSVDVRVEDLGQPSTDYDEPNPGLKRVLIRVSTPPQSAGRLVLDLGSDGDPAAAIRPVVSLESWGWEQ